MLGLVLTAGGARGAQRFAHRMPRLVRYLMEGLGTPDAQSADLMSYLLFDASYTRALIDIGYRDASDRIDEIEAFIAAAGRGPRSRRSAGMRARGRLARPCARAGGGLWRRIP